MSFNQFLNQYDDDIGTNTGGSSGTEGSILSMPTKRLIGTVDVSSPSPNPLLENNSDGRQVGDYFAITKGGMLSYPGFAAESSSSLAEAGDFYVYMGKGMGNNGSDWSEFRIPIGANSIGTDNLAAASVTSAKLAAQTTITVQSNGDSVDISADAVNAVMFGKKTDGAWRMLATRRAMIFQCYSAASSEWVVCGAFQSPIA